MGVWFGDFGGFFAIWKQDFLGRGHILQVIAGKQPELHQDSCWPIHNHDGE